MVWLLKGLFVFEIFPHFPSQHYFLSLFESKQHSTPT